MTVRLSSLFLSLFLFDLSVFADAYHSRHWHCPGWMLVAICYQKHKRAPHTYTIHTHTSKQNNNHHATTTAEPNSRAPPQTTQQTFRAGHLIMWRHVWRSTGETAFVFRCFCLYLIRNDAQLMLRPPPARPRLRAAAQPPSLQRTQTASSSLQSLSPWSSGYGDNDSVGDEAVCISVVSFDSVNGHENHPQMLIDPGSHQCQHRNMMYIHSV